MPFVHVTFVEGAGPEQQNQLVKDITNSVVERLGVPVQSVSVVLNPVRSSQWGVGGTLLSETIGE